jgi:hypothetical protein
MIWKKAAVAFSILEGLRRTTEDLSRDS